MKSQKLDLPKGLLDGYSLDEVASIAREADRVSKNDAEASLQAKLTDEGALVIRRGWPDFMVIGPGDQIRVIEVKDGKDQVRPTQKLLMRILGRVGFAVSVARRRGGDGAWNFNCPCCGMSLDPMLRLDQIRSSKDPYEDHGWIVG